MKNIASLNKSSHIDRKKNKKTHTPGEHVLYGK